jgi:hypothetical protein
MRLHAENSPSPARRPLIHQFLSEHSEQGRQIFNQTVQIIMEAPLQGEIILRSTGLIMNDRTVVTSAHSFLPFLNQILFAYGAAYFHDFTIKLEITDAWGHIYTQKEISLGTLLFGFSDQINIHFAANLLSNTDYRFSIPPDLDMAFLVMEKETFSDLLGVPVQTIKPDLNYPRFGSTFYTLGYSSKEGDVGLRATRFQHDQRFGVLHGSDYNTYARVTRTSSNHNTFGDSGGPLLSFQQGELRLIGIVTSGTVTQSYSISLYTSFRHPLVQQLLENLEINYLEDQTPGCFRE